MKLLIVDDENDFASALASGLRNQFYAVDIASDGETGWEMAEVNDYDLIILDLNLPGLDGLEVCRRIRKSRPQQLIMMLTARDNLSEKVTGFDAGADDYLTKPFQLEELTARIRALLRRDLRVRETILENGDLKLDPASRLVWFKNEMVELNRTAYGILEYFLRHPGEVISQEELLGHVWDSQISPFSNVVRVQVTLLRRKLGDDTKNPRFIETIAGQGYRLIKK